MNEGKRFVMKFCVVLVRTLLLRFTAEFYNKQIKKVDSNIQPLFKEIFRKFGECENRTKLSIQMRDIIIQLLRTLLKLQSKTVANETSDEIFKAKNFEIYINCPTTHYISEKYICIIQTSRS